MRTVSINGVDISGDALVLLFDIVTNPDPKAWYRFERDGNTVNVTRKQETDDATRGEAPEVQV